MYCSALVHSCHSDALETNLIQGPYRGNTLTQLFQIREIRLQRVGTCIGRLNDKGAAPPYVGVEDREHQEGTVDLHCKIGEGESELRLMTSMS